VQAAQNDAAAYIGFGWLKFHEENPRLYPTKHTELVINRIPHFLLSVKQFLQFYLRNSRPNRKNVHFHGLPA
jgi:hypothetical protein